MFLIGTLGVVRAVLALDEVWNKSLMHSSYFSDMCAPILISVVLSGIHSNSTDSEGSIERACPSFYKYGGTRKQFKTKWIFVYGRTRPLT